MSPRSLALTAVTLIALAAPTAAGAVATVTVPPDTCLVNPGPKPGPTPLPFTATGLLPGHIGTAKLTGPGVAGVPLAFTADATGATAGTATWGSSIPSATVGKDLVVIGATPSKGTPGTLDLTDLVTSAVLASTPVLFGELGLKVAKASSITQKVRWEISGLSAITHRRSYYGFYFDAKAVAKHHFKVLARVKLGKAKGPCGYLKMKRRIVPFNRYGAFVLAITTTPKWDPKAYGIAAPVVTRRVAPAGY